MAKTKAKTTSRKMRDSAYAVRTLEIGAKCAKTGNWKPLVKRLMHLAARKV